MSSLFQFSAKLICRPTFSSYSDHSDLLNLASDLRRGQLERDASLPMSSDIHTLNLVCYYGQSFSGYSSGRRAPYTTLSLSFVAGASVKSEYVLMSSNPMRSSIMTISWWKYHRME